MPEELIKMTPTENDQTVRFTIDDTHQGDTPPEDIPTSQVSEEEDEIRLVLEEVGLAERYPNKKGIELLKELAKSYKNIEGFSNQLKQENSVLGSRDLIAQKILADWRAQQQNPPVARTEESEQDTQAKAYIHEAARPILEPLIRKMQEMEQALALSSFLNQQAFADEGFRTAWTNGDIGRTIQEKNLPPNTDGIRVAYDLLKSGNKQVTEQTQTEDLADRKRRAMNVEEGGVRNRPSFGPPKLQKYEQLVREGKAGDTDALIRQMEKELGVKLTP